MTWSFVFGPVGIWNLNRTTDTPGDIDLKKKLFFFLPPDIPQTALFIESSSAGRLAISGAFMSHMKALNMDAHMTEFMPERTIMMKRISKGKQ